MKYEAVFGEKLINEISKFLEYKKESGSFVWVNPTSNRVSVGMIAGNSHKQSYTTIYIYKWTHVLCARSCVVNGNWISSAWNY